MLTPGFDLEKLRLLVDHRFLVYQANAPCLLYVTSGMAGRPYIATLRGPSGRNVLEDSPADHVHHHGVWWGHGDVNGIDFYNELPSGRPMGSIEHAAWLDIVDSAPKFGFVEVLYWKDGCGRAVIQEERSLHAHYLDASSCTVDLSSSYLALRELQFGDTKESALPSVRLAEALAVRNGGTLISSRGNLGEAQIMGQPAEWIDCSGTRQLLEETTSLVEGVACFDHPQNPSHPTKFFARDYGVISPRQGHYFIGRTRLRPGDGFRLQHRLFLHLGNAIAAQVGRHYEQYCAESGEDERGRSTLGVWADTCSLTGLSIRFLARR